MTDLLLEWMSFRMSGRMDELPAGLCHPSAPRRLLDDLSLLGHAEQPSLGTWKIAAPAIAGGPEISGGPCIGYLSGARTAGLLSRLSAATQAADVRMDTHPVDGRPSVVQLTADTWAALAAAGAGAGIPLQMNAGYTVLACTPAIREWPRTPCRMVSGKVEKVLRFSGSSHRWAESSLEEATSAARGFFRIKRDWDTVSILKTSADSCAYIEDRAGRLAAAEKRRHAGWDAATETFSLPVALMPPALIGRAATLCSGRLPHFDAATKRIEFASIRRPMLRLLLEITGLRLA